MPPKRKRRGAKIKYGSGHVFQLFCGRDIFGVGFGDDMAAMRLAWPTPRGAVFELCQERDGPGARPWGAFMFDRRGGSIEKRQAAWKKYQREQSDRFRAEVPRLA